MPCKVWGEINYPFPNFNGTAVEVWEWISNFIPYFVIDVIIYPTWYNANDKGNPMETIILTKP